ncbi:MAG TPA: hypothetical protein P5294_09895 [Smithellaceae bacterium]|nr:hypothetical protein [Smithellaceae bacterium]HRS89706.1 hypothetical protein [Smithellaceae bacterium]HRV26840.1 hypothetical protein [Smithellaceae bacterium]
MTCIPHPGRLDLSDELKQQIIQSNNKSIGISGKILESGTQKNKFLAGVNYQQNRCAIWRFLNITVFLYIFSIYSAKRKERICDKIKAT